MSFVPLKVCTCQNIPMHFVFLSCWNVIAWTSWGFGTDNSSVLQSTLIKHRWMSHWNALIDNNQNRCESESGQLVNGHVWSPWWVIQFSRWEQRNMCCCGFNWALATHCLYQQQQSSRLLLGKILPPLSSAIYLSFSFTFLQEVRGLVFYLVFSVKNPPILPYY